MNLIENLYLKKIISNFAIRKQKNCTFAALDLTG